MSDILVRIMVTRNLSMLTWADRNEVGKLLVKYAWSLVGTVGRWGGDDPMSGFDCSGYVVECLKGIELLPRRGDWTAETLFHKFESDKYDRLVVPSLLFWYKEGEIVHTAIYIGQGCLLEAGGVTSETTNLADAVKQNAYVRMRGIEERPDYVSVDVLKLRLIT